MDKAVVSLAYDLLAIILPFLAVAAVELLRRKLGVEKMQRIQKELEAKQELATLAVMFVEQAYQEYKGLQKYHAAAEWLSKRAQEQGLKVSAEEIQGLIEAALRGFKDEFGEEWAEKVNK